ncbi:hypothetical protein [Clostridium sp. HBUAS56010]|uniref:hypothetical protein n=1 Tax=Clostridium sp. HBUAS56010 TaxID=2571127 RepID=UPI001177C04E|nr:hypothetical protein [Clostridium sp. HBUAS56010]
MQSTAIKINYPYSEPMQHDIQKSLYQSRQKAKARRRKVYIIKQRLLGLLLVVISILALFITMEGSFIMSAVIGLGFCIYK